MFPLGVTDNDKLIVNRKASEVSSFVNLKRKRKKKAKQRETEVMYYHSLALLCLEEKL